MTKSISYPVIDMYKTGENIKHLREERIISAYPPFKSIWGWQASRQFTIGSVAPACPRWITSAH